MQAPKVLIYFSIKFFVLYIGLLLLSFPLGIDDKARDFLGNSSEIFLNNVIDQAEFKVFPQENKTANTNLLFQIFEKENLDKMRDKMRKSGLKNLNIPTLAYEIDSNRTLLMPLIFLLALIFAYPSSLLNKLLPIIFGFFLMLVFVFFELTSSVIYTIEISPDFFPNYELSSIPHTLVKLIDGLFIEASYIVAILIWIMVCIRLEDLKKIKFTE